MPFNSLILPLLGGFLFVSYFNASSFFAARQSRERLLFYAAIAGVLLLFLGRGAEVVVTSQWPGLIDAIESFAPFPHAFANIVAFALGAVAWWPLNFYFRIEWVTRQVVSRYGDALELLLVDASDTDALVILTMDDDKVYIGYIDRQPPNPDAPDPQLKIVPLISGYRSKDTRELVLTNYYDQALSNLAGQASPYATDDREWKLEDFVKVLPMHRILSAGFFDIDAYMAFSNTNKATGYESP